jgi:arabinofuranosyltransferase
VTRQDTAILYLPACVLVAITAARRHGRAVLRPIAVGLSPALVWTLFALVYYGFILPNTAYAKAIVEGLTRAERVKQGILYSMTELLWDPWTWLVLLLSGYGAVRARRVELLALFAGVLLYLAYIVGVAAAGTHLAGRFFAVPFAVAALSLLASIDRREGLALGATAVLFAWMAPMSPIRTIGCSWTPVASGGRAPLGLIDTRYFVCNEGAALANFSRTTTLPDHAWLKEGLVFRDQPQRVRYGGAVGVAMGYFGYAAGPAKIIIDPVGLTDPLLARLPPSARDPNWMPGHFVRAAPEGYVESLESGSNRIADPDLREYYESLRAITRGRLFSVSRWREIFAMNLGRRDYLIRRYLARLRRNTG